MQLSAQVQEDTIHMIKHHQREDIQALRMLVVIQDIFLNKIGPVSFQNLKLQGQDTINFHQNSVTIKVQNSEMKLKKINKIKLFEI
jgi:hypothetical protein